MSYIEDMNYANDFRNQKAPSLTVVIYHDDGSEDEVALPTKWAVCYVCNGKGTHVNPSIDCGGLSAEDFADDPDFYDSYMGGTYDQPCNRCHGRTTEEVVDWDALALTPTLLKAYEEQLESDAAYEAESRAERMMGA